MYQPDFNQLLKVLRREKPDRPVLFEFIINDDGPSFELLLGKPFEGSASEPERARQIIKAYHAGGYDHAVLPVWDFGFVGFPKGDIESKESHSQDEGGVITDQESFDAYAWQEVTPEPFSVLEETEKDLPDAMKYIICGNCGVEENVVELVGFQELCFMQVDEPELLEQIVNAVGSRLLAHYEEALKYDSVGAVLLNDDWGFKTQTMMSPAFLREYIIPWHRRMAAAAHAVGKPVLMHSCGNLSEVWDDIIDDVKVDGKHSYEDGIQPVEEAYEEYGSRIAILGGIDMDFLCRKTPEEIYNRSAEMIERTHGCEGYALGSGNSIASYVPVENYEAMTRAVLEKR